MTELVREPAERDLADVLTEDPLDVPGVVARLTELQAVLDAMPPLFTSNPAADFNRLYHTITSNVLERLDSGRFADPEFLALLDVEFAKRYFEALRLWSAGSPRTPGVWRVLFERMDGPDARPLPSAAAGVNAHINFDLPFAVVSDVRPARLAADRRHATALRLPAGQRHLRGGDPGAAPRFPGGLAALPRQDQRQSRRLVPGAPRGVQPGHGLA